MCIRRLFYDKSVINIEDKKDRAFGASGHEKYFSEIINTRDNCFWGGKWTGKKISPKLGKDLLCFLLPPVGPLLVLHFNENIF